MNTQIGIIGPETKNIQQEIRENMLKDAATIGKLLAKNAILITGGGTGVAQSASKAAFEAGGITVGTPGRKRGSATEGTMIEICTPIEIGDYLFAGTLSCDCIITFPGDAGTLAELAIAYRNKIPLVFLKEYGGNLLPALFRNVPLTYPVSVANDAAEAAQIALEIASERVRQAQSLKAQERRKTQ